MVGHAPGPVSAGATDPTLRPRHTARRAAGDHAGGSGMTLASCPRSGPAWPQDAPTIPGDLLRDALGEGHLRLGKRGPPLETAAAMRAGS